MEHHGLVGTAGTAAILLRNNQMTKKPKFQRITVSHPEPSEPVFQKVKVVYPDGYFDKPVFQEIKIIKGVAVVTDKPQC